MLLDNDESLGLTTLGSGEEVEIQKRGRSGQAAAMAYSTNK